MIDQKSGNWKYSRLSFFQYLETGTKFGTIVSNKIILFLGIKGKPTVGGRGGGNFPTQIRVKWTNISSAFDTITMKYNSPIGYSLIHLEAFFVTWTIEP